MKIRSGVKLGSLSDIGCQRENNEDRCKYWESAGDKDFNRKGRLAIIADGMGGYEGGQEASRIAVETVEEIYAGAATGHPQELLVAGLQSAHTRILQYATGHPALRGMGTTCTAIAVVGNHLVYAHIGDSRLYLVHTSKISRLTKDHSYVNRLVEAGIISPGDAETHPQRNVLTAALGAGDEIVPECPQAPIALASDDVLALCTDGLWGMVTDDEIRSLASAKPPQSACQHLIQLARQRGGPDNITVMILQIKKLS